MKSLLLSIQFLTIIPFKIKGDVTEETVGRSAAFFPLTGALQGLLAALAALLLFPVFPEEIVSGFIVLLSIVVTGGFHLDGLADTFDATAVKSTGERSLDKEKRLAVMKDSATGAIGVTAIVMVILLKYLFINALFHQYAPWSVAYLLFIMPLFSKWLMVPAMFHTRPARDTGLGKMFIEQARWGVLLASSLMLLAIYGVVTFSAGGLVIRDAFIFLLVVAPPLYAFTLLWVRFCSRRFGGSTGDTLGALGEMADILFLATAFLWF